MKKIIVIGGGLAGLITSVKLIEAGIPCLLIEKKNYPFHRVCGEYISNEAKPFLESLGLFPHQFAPASINRLQLSAINGKSAMLDLDLGGFGISRYTYDQFVYEQAVKRGVEFQLNTEVESVAFENDKFLVKTSSERYEADVVIGSFGKRSKLDLTMNREFVQKRSPYVGIKYHAKTNHNDKLIALHNFPGGYCGINNVEGGKSNICYLTHRDGLRQQKNIQQFQEAIMFQNPWLKSLFEEATFLTGPETINEISFETKSPVEQHILMAGDAAGMITPLCGNGMAMAIHSGKILAEHVTRYCREKNYSRAQLEQDYANAWKQIFSARLWRGRHIQRLFGNEWASTFAVGLVKNSTWAARAIVRNTHGSAF